MKQKIVRTTNFEETKSFAKSLLLEMKQGGVICLYGDLGAGKTTFAQGIGHALGIKKPLTSPTFLIIKTYEVDSKEEFPNITTLYHVDLYRTQTERDILETGLVDMMTDQSGISIIEWAERMEDLLPEKRVDVKFAYLSENERKITINNFYYE